MIAENHFQKADIRRIATAGKFSSPYLDREVDLLNESTKQPCRDRVAEHILRHHTFGNFRLFSFPSLHWAFENQIASARSGRSEFVAVERDIHIMNRSIAWMPGKRKRTEIDETKIGNFNSIVSTTASIINAECGTFMGIGRGDFSTKQKYAWRIKYKLWSAIWLDFTSQICLEVEKVLLRLSSRCDLLAPEIPIAVTVLNGREKKDVSNKMIALETDRVGYISKILDCGTYRGFVLDDSFEYDSGNGSKMLTVMGRLTENRPRKSQ